MENGEIMFSGRSDSSTTVNEKHPSVPNFRVFHSAGYGPSILDQHSGMPVVLYSLVSLFSAAFSRKEHVKNMVVEIDRAFFNPNTVAPIFYINSRKLADITYPLLFPAKDATTKAKRATQGPLHTAEAKWLANFRDAELYQLEQGVQDIRRHILQWSIFLNESGPYPAIYDFVSHLFLENDEEFDSLISEVISLYVAHNKRKFTNGDKSKEAQEGALSSGDRELLLQYLKQELSVFLVLAHYNTLQRLKSAYRDADVNIAVSITETSLFQPVLTYPISASGDGLAEKTFSLFFKIQDRYIEACKQRSDLPSVTTPLVVVDVLTSNSCSPSLKSSSPDSLGVEETKVTATLPLPPPPSNNDAASSSILHSPSLFKPSEAAVITERILVMMSSHKKTGQELAEVRGPNNGIKCCIRVVEKVGSSISVDPNIETQKNALRETIMSAVDNTLQTGLEEVTVFVFGGYRFQLTVTKPEIEYNNDNYKVLKK